MSVSDPLRRVPVVLNGLHVLWYCRCSAAVPLHMCVTLWTGGGGQAQAGGRAPHTPNGRAAQIDPEAGARRKGPNPLPVRGPGRRARIASPPDASRARNTCPESRRSAAGTLVSAGVPCRHARHTGGH